MSTSAGRARGEARAGEAEALPATPLFAQYEALRARCPGALLLFRLGDFFELFGRDAQMAAPLLGLVLTSRDGRTPMCGVPAVALEEHLAALVRAGHRVAVAEQMEAPSGRSLVRRAIVRVAAPSTLLAPEGAGEEGVRLAAAVAVAGEECEEGALSPERAREAALVVADPASGEVRAARFEGPEAAVRAVRAAQQVEAAEILLDPVLMPEGLPATAPLAAPWPDLWRDGARGQGLGGVDEDAPLPDLPAHLLGEDPALAPWPVVARAARALYRYLWASLGEGGARLGRLEALAPDGQGWAPLGSGVLRMEPATLRQLEVTRSLSGSLRGSLWATVDRTRTPMGRRLLRAWLEAPSTDRGLILSRQEAVAALVADDGTRDALAGLLAQLGDLERLATRAATGAMGPRELVRLGRALACLPLLAAALRAAPPGPLRAWDEALAVPEGLAEAILETLVDDPPFSPREGGLVRAGRDPEVDRLRALAAGGRQALSALEEEERARTGVRGLKLGYHRKLGYYLEVARGRAERLPEDFRLVQGMAGAERYTTPALEAHAAAVAQAQGRLADLEYEIFLDLRRRVAAHLERVRAAARAVAEVDVRVGLAEVARAGGWVRPEIVPGRGISLRAARHPVVEAALGPGAFVPNDAELGLGTDLWVVTGPNMGGKSTYLRQVALCVILAQAGSFVPARSARLAPVDRLFARIGAGDDLAGGQSTFMVEMAEVAAILRSATSRSLVVLDELGRGTATFDGLALAWAVIEHLAERVHALTLVATHYHELIALADRLPRAANASVQAVEAGGEVRFLRRVVPGGADRSYGVAVARLAGVPAPVLRRAEAILAELEAGRSPAGEAAAAGPVQARLMPAPDSLRQEILALDLGRTSPLDALVYLTALQERLRREGGQGA
ncbi:MAG: DNA mismatch repair protein MutS [Firmicutes bacterium]|nr:DNA mismatch repair protein MutS [Bacillota bacterium]